jgi:cytochrome b561
MLISIHVGAALFHHFYRRDGVLTRMLPGRSAEAEQTAD